MGPLQKYVETTAEEDGDKAEVHADAVPGTYHQSGAAYLNRC